MFCDEDVVVDLFIKVEIGQGLLIHWFLFDHLFHLLYAKFTYCVQIVVNLCDGDLFLLCELTGCRERMSEGESDGLR